MFSCDFLRFVDISFHFVYISRCVTHSVQRVLVKISFHTSVLICKAETSVFVNKVAVLVFQFERYQDRFWAAKVGRYFYIQNIMHMVGE